MPRLIGATLVAMVLGSPALALAQADAAFVTIRDWDADGFDGAPQTEATRDTLLLKAGTIWTPKAYADFVLRFEYRPLSMEGAGALLLRSNIDESRRRQSYEVVLDRSSERGRLSGERQVLHELQFESGLPVADATTWIPVEVRAERDRLSVSLGGVIVSTADRAEEGFGTIGFRAGTRGGIELRGMRLAPVAIEPTTVGAGLPRANDPGITAPKAAHRAYPRYTRAAMQAKAQGNALLEFVIEADGRIGDVRVIEAPHPDLAVSSLACLRKWRFTPALKDGAPIAVVATMELNFRLK